MKIIAISAIGPNLEIGLGGELPWPKISLDLAYFRKVTWGYPVIMGRKTYESLPSKLEGRRNIVITSSRAYHLEPKLETYDSLEEALKWLKDHKFIFIIGGSTLYQYALDKGYCDNLLLTRIRWNIPAADKFFPLDPISNSTWKLQAYTDTVDPFTNIPLSFEVYSKEWSEEILKSLQYNLDDIG